MTENPHRLRPDIMTTGEIMKMDDGLAKTQTFNREMSKLEVLTKQLQSGIKDAGRDAVQDFLWDKLMDRYS